MGWVLHAAGGLGQKAKGPRLRRLLVAGVIAVHEFLDFDFLVFLLLHLLLLLLLLLPLLLRLELIPRPAALQQRVVTDLLEYRLPCLVLIRGQYEVGVAIEHRS